MGEQGKDVEAGWEGVSCHHMDDAVIRLCYSFVAPSSRLDAVQKLFIFMPVSYLCVDPAKTSRYQCIPGLIRRCQVWASHRGTARGLRRPSQGQKLRVADSGRRFHAPDRRP